MLAIRWDLEERVEDALVDFLKRGLSGEMTVYPAASPEAIQYPCAVVTCAETAPIGPGANWHSARQCAVSVQVLTEAAPLKDGAGNIVKTARERNADARHQIMARLVAGTFHMATAADGNNDLNKIAYPLGVIFASMQPVSTSRSVDNAERKYVTDIVVSVKAEPVEE